ncbi:hypothetical protein HO133_007779 [Letharia lupina]|uniref:Uncharacterized protein n=1 Tax=Letharia lupina TaxID=560253 RepID=A0A8H6FH85_9LECA|nr:uncharacterized protein HO133_007779 [Letharia lupina]KAF6228051.1 hypothetical protein HO133_007779 [Letharia lupina]
MKRTLNLQTTTTITILVDSSDEEIVDGPSSLPLGNAMTNGGAQSETIGSEDFIPDEDKDEDESGEVAYVRNGS